MEELNTESRKALKRKLGDVNTSVFEEDDLATLLVANFLREISDSLARIDENINLIENELAGRAPL